MNVMSDPGEPV